MDYEKEKRSVLSQEQEMQTCGSKKNWEELDELIKKRHPGGSGTCVGTHRTKREKEKMTQFEMFVTEGNEKADDLAKAGAMSDEGSWLKQEQQQCSGKERR